MKKGKWKFLSLLIVLGLLLSACSSGTSGKKSEGQEGQGSEPELVDPSSFPKTVVNEETEIDGGSLTYALVSDTAFEGILDYAFYESSPDAEVISFFAEPIFAYDANYQITNDGESAAKFEMSEDGKTMTVTIQDGVTWHDGEPLKAEDYAFSFEIIGHPDYTGVRYGDALISGIVGMEDYHNGKADTISGIKILNDKQLTITWEEANPSLLSGIWSYAEPKHHFEGIEIGDLASSDKIHTDLLGFGPFKVTNIVPGESVEYEAYENYYGGAPKLDSVVLKVVSPTTIGEAIKKGDVDIASFPTDQYDKDYVPTNFQYLADMDAAYTYIGFKLGHWDAEAGVAVQDKDTPLQDVKLRQAIGYAMDNKSVAERFYQGLRVPATTLMIPFFADFHNPDIEGYSYNTEKANQLLDEAGYKDVDGDGYREDLEGNEMVFNFASMSGGETAEPLANFYIQNWKDVGIHVQLLEGRLHEMNSFYDRVEGDDEAVDIYQGAWGTGTDPDPYGLWSKLAPYNYPRFVNDKNEELLAAGHSEDAFDQEFRKDIYDQWQQLMVDEAPVIPTLYRYYLMAVNNRVKNYSIEAGSELGWEDVAVTAEKAFVEE
ncbi:oligopeptide ABC transporter substrate-binding protein [Caldibacillus lycopersici]|uniref:Oligopeptide ABC transporter substrate-binding protein n=1 Tax=Perspicuibacillus lycopersici TaxID=1325689 RepID=A0AAE3LNW0_9BACI|nr:oligopeptide ABC transporter substrate-binding protein [Perspicuibacillus lycopersici]MCU9614277.1 oligopeptide ABC transporter substrate-binding protein [Perspicuibacillus lycopersici]